MTAAAVAAGLGVQLPSPLEEFQDETLERAGVRLLLKRDDLIHPDLPGNKWRKLKYNLEAALAEGHGTILTFGGAYSNHIRAVAAAGHLFGLSTIGVIRGEEHLPLNDTLAYASDHGMRLTYLDRASYRDKTNPRVVSELRSQFGDFYLVPEGGSNALAVQGCAELPAEIDRHFDVICCPCGTGGTLAGVSGGLQPDQRAIGFSALKGAGSFLEKEVQRLQEEGLGYHTENWRIADEYHFGGFAKKPAELESFVDRFEVEHGTRLDWVYVAKMMYGLIDLTRRGEFTRGSTVVALITG